MEVCCSLYSHLPSCWVIFLPQVAEFQDESMIKEGRVYLNESSLPLEENYVNEFSEDYMEKLTVPEGCLFVLGDNRRESVDSRYLDDRFVLAENVYAKVMFTLLPRIKKLY